MGMEVSEKKIVAGCLKGRARSQRLLYDRYSPVLFGICLRYTKNEMEAKDVLQETFMKIFTRLGQFRDQGSFEGWMKRIAVNTALNYLSQQKKFRFSEELESVVAVPSLKWEDADQFTQQDLLVLIRNLPIGYQTVFNLYEVEGYSHHEIAEMLSISESTSKTQLFQARRKLRILVDNLFEKSRYGA